MLEYEPDREELGYDLLDEGSESLYRTDVLPYDVLIDRETQSKRNQQVNAFGTIGTFFVNMIIT